MRAKILKRIASIMDCTEQMLNQIFKWIFILIMAVVLGWMFIPFVAVAYLIQKCGSTKPLAIDGSPSPIQPPKISILEWITRILRWIVILTLGWIVVSCYKVFTAYPDDIDDIAKSLAIGGSPFVIQLPNSLFMSSPVTINIGRYGTGIGQCGHVEISFNGEVRSPMLIGNQPVQISLNNGLLDLTPYTQLLKECDAMTIKTRGYLDECLLYVRYANAKIIDMDTHCTY